MEEERDYTNTSLGSYNRVSVGREFRGKCGIKRCKCNKVVYVFVDDGTPKMSRLWGTFCRKHLAKAIQHGWEDNDKCWKKRQKALKKKIEEEAKITLGLNS